MQLSSNLVGPLFAVTGVVALLATPGWVVVGGRLGKKVAYSRGLVVSMLAAIAIFFLPLVLWIGAWVRLRHYDLDEERFEEIRLQLAETGAGTGGND